MKTKEELDKLKAQWCEDPCWDIEATEGFEQHEEELLRFRFKMEAHWREEREAEENRDPLEVAKEWMNPYKQSYAGPKPDKAIAYALIALVERLDKIISTDYADETGAVRVDTGIP